MPEQENTPTPPDPSPTPKKGIGIDARISIAGLVISGVFSLIGLLVALQANYTSNKANATSIASNALANQSNQNSILNTLDARVLEQQKAEYFAIRDSLGRHKATRAPFRFDFIQEVAERTRTWTPVPVIEPSDTGLAWSNTLVSPARGWLLANLLYHYAEAFNPPLVTYVFFSGDFSFADLTNHQFQGVVTGGDQIHGRGIRIKDCQFRNCIMPNHHFPEAIVEDCIIRSSGFTHTNFRRSQWKGFTRVLKCSNDSFNMASVDLLQARFYDIKRDPLNGDTVLFEDVDFSNANFSHTVMEGPITIRNCRFDQCNFSHARWDQVLFVDCSFRKTRWESSLLTDCKFRKDTLSQSLVEDVTGYHLQFSECLLRADTLRGGATSLIHPHRNQLEGNQLVNFKIQPPYYSPLPEVVTESNE